MDNEQSESSSTQLTNGKLIGGKFKLEDKIGQGSFGMIFKCINIESQEPCAIKLEKRNQRHSSMLVREIKVMMEVKNEKGFARLNGYGKEDEYNYVAMTYLGRNLDSLLRKCGGKFKLPCLLNVFEQSLLKIQTLHSKNLIHRDIKPENFVIGYGSNFNQVHLIDFGLAKYYIDSEGNHIPFFEKKGMIGTARYASVNAHLGHEQSRRDDLEGLGYIILYFAKSSLPWQSIQAENKEEKYEKIKQMKLTISFDNLCQGLPMEFQQYFQHVKNLDFSQKPNYDYLLKLIEKMRIDNNIEPNLNLVDWQELPEYRQRKKFQTFTAQSHNQYQKRIAELDVSPRGSQQLLGGGGQHGHRISESQGLKQIPQRIQRKSQHNHTNLLQIPNKEGTQVGGNLAPSISQVSANTSKMNNFSNASINNDNDNKRKSIMICSTGKLQSIGDFDKYQEEEGKNNQQQQQQQQQNASKFQQQNGQQQQQQQQKNSQSNSNFNNNNSNSIKVNGKQSVIQVNGENNNNGNGKKQQQQSSKQEDFYSTSENMGTLTQDYHTQYPINVMAVKKSYKNGQIQ